MTAEDAGSNADAALRGLMDEYGTQLLRLCYSWLGDLSLAEDAVQDTFVKAWRGMDAFRAESSEKTWLTRIAINSCKDVRRTRWFRRAACAPIEEAESKPAQDEAFSDDTVFRAVSALPDGEKLAVLLHYYQGFSVKETADLMNLKVSAVNSRLARAREKLRQSLRGWYFDEE